MKLEHSFDVDAPIDIVWRALNDLEIVAPCLPGASITGHDGDGAYHGELEVELGPTTAAYRGTIRIASSDEATHTATLSAEGSDTRGQGGASATIVNRLTERDGVTRVHIATDFSITGRLARFGRGGMIEDACTKLLQDFATCLATRLAGARPARQPTGAEVTAGDAAPEAIVAPAAPPAATRAEVTAGDAAPEAVVAPAAPAEATGAEVTAGDAAPEAIVAPAAPPAATGAEVTAGDAAPEAVVAAPSAARPGGALSGGPAPDGSWVAPPPAGPRPGGARSRPPGAPIAAAPGPAASRPGPAQPPAAEPPRAGGLSWSVLWARIKRLFAGGRRR